MKDCASSSVSPLRSFPFPQLSCGSVLFNTLQALEISLPPEVANGMMIFPFISFFSMNVLITVGAIFHQIGKPMNIMSYVLRLATVPLMAGREDLSAISIVERLFLFLQSR